MKDGKEIVNTKGVYFGKGGIRFGANFHVGSNGNMFAIEGTIGGWDIGSSSLTGGSLKLNSDGSLEGPGWSITSGGEATFSNVKSANIKGGTISGGDRTGGSINPSKVSAPANGDFGGGSLNDWCQNIVTTSVTADYIKGKISSIEILTVKTLSAQKILIGSGRRGIEVATQTWAAQMVNDKLENYAKKDDIPTLNKTTINGVTVYCP